MRLTQAEFRHFTKTYVRPLANDLGLRDWIIDVERTEQDADVDGSFQRLATCEPCFGRKKARIEFYEPFWNLEPPVQKATLIHELLHCHFFPLLDIVRKDLPDQLGSSAFDLLYGGFLRQLEYAVDGIAAEIARLSKGIPDPDIG